MGGNSRQSFVCPGSGMLGGGIYKCPFLQVGYNRNDHFRYFLVARVRLIEVSIYLIKVSFKVNKGIKFGDFGYCPLNRVCPLNTGFTVAWFSSFVFELKLNKVI